MDAGRKIFHTRFAPASPFFATVGNFAFEEYPAQTWLDPGGYIRSLALFLLCLVPCLAFAADNADTASATAKRQAASAQFEKAEEQHSALNEKPANKRTLAEYKQVVSSYRRVYLITPRAPEVPESSLAVAELYVEMGDRFGRSYYQSAVDSYRFLIHEYPTSKHVQDAMLKMAQLEKDQLGDPRAAAKLYDDFLKKYPRSTRRREAQEGRAEAALLLKNSEPVSAAKSASTDGATTKDEEPAALARETREDLPPLPPASPSGGVPRVRRISTKASADSTRVIIDLEDTVQYSSARIRNPDRIFFDIHDARLTPEVAKAAIRIDGDLLTGVRAAQNHAGIVRVVLDVNGVKDYNATLQDNPPELIIDLYPNSGTTRAARTKRSAPTPQAADDGVVDVASNGSEERSSVRPAAVETKPAAAEALPPSLVRGAVSGAARGKSAKNVSSKPDLIQPSTVPQPTRDGQATLTRALGLKIGRIVVDAGHGGHDTGTIGPTGLMEKDLCLDVALRLGKIIQQRLPGADVVYTRSDDTFIPLEERTHIANEAKADLFISIHANSSHDHGARGIETYYLNLKGSPDAMEVASRENATANESVHDLEDLVKKIARSEKIDESREFAADIQDSLAKRIQRQYKPVKDRGVRKAPFVVLIGADMPSILTEISFLSNPADEQLLKKPEHRQRVAEGLYQGVASYLQSMNSMTAISPRLPLAPAGRSAAVASVDQGRNQR
jgi:N-acetylmuramoyl-L-alanine amidase